MFHFLTNFHQIVKHAKNNPTNCIKPFIPESRILGQLNQSRMNIPMILSLNRSQFTPFIATKLLTAHSRSKKKHKPCIFCHFWIPQNGREHPQDSHLQNISRERQTSPISGLDFEYISVFPFPTIFPKFQDLNLVFSHFSHFSHGTFSTFEDPKTNGDRRLPRRGLQSALHRAASQEGPGRRRALDGEHVELSSGGRCAGFTGGMAGGCDQNAQREISMYPLVICNIAIENGHL